MMNYKVNFFNLLACVILCFVFACLHISALFFLELIVV